MALAKIFVETIALFVRTIDRQKIPQNEKLTNKVDHIYQKYQVLLSLKTGTYKNLTKNVLTLFKSLVVEPKLNCNFDQHEF